MPIAHEPPPERDKPPVWVWLLLGGFALALGSCGACCVGWITPTPHGEPRGSELAFLALVLAIPAFMGFVLVLVALAMGINRHTR